MPKNGHALSITNIKSELTIFEVRGSIGFVLRTRWHSRRHSAFLIFINGWMLLFSLQNNYFTPKDVFPSCFVRCPSPKQQNRPPIKATPYQLSCTASTHRVNGNKMHISMFDKLSFVSKMRVTSTKRSLFSCAWIAWESTSVSFSTVDAYSSDGLPMSPRPPRHTRQRPYAPM